MPKKDLKNFVLYTGELAEINVKIKCWCQIHQDVKTRE